MSFDLLRSGLAALLASVALILFCAGDVRAQSTAPTAAQGAHVHGAGRLDVAIEGNTVQMELEAPGADLLGFEHAARTDAQKTALAAAKAVLGKPLSVVVPTAEALCKVTSAQVATTGLEAAHKAPGHSGHGHAGHGQGGPGAKAKDAAAEPAGDEHAEFRATYVLTCARIEALRSLAFPYFTVFKGAERLSVTMIGPKGQTQTEATRDKPRIDLTGMM